MSYIILHILVYCFLHACYTNYFLCNKLWIDGVVGIYMRVLYDRGIQSVINVQCYISLYYVLFFYIYKITFLNKCYFSKFLIYGLLLICMTNK